MLQRLFAGAMMLLLAGCSSNPIKESWKDPAVSPPLSFDKTLVIALLDTPANRRVAEEQLVKQLPMIHGETSYPLIEDGELKDLVAAKKMVKDKGFTKAFLLRQVSTKTELVERPSMGVSHGFWGRYSSFVSLQTSTVESRERTTYELSLYTLENDKLIWTGNGELINPSRIASSVERLSKGLVQDWQEQGLILPPTQE